MCKNFSTKDKIQDSDIWFSELFNLNLKFKKYKEKYVKDEDELESYVFDILPENNKPVRVF